MRCINCGVEIQTGLNFCPDCGTPVPKVAPPSGFIGDVGMIKAETIHIDGGMPQPKLRPERPPQPAIPETQEKKKKKMRVSGNEMTLTLADGVELELVRVPAGKFLMGSDKIGERPQHKLYLPEYLIGKHPVTVAQFTAFAKASGYKTTAEVEGSGYRTGSKWENVKGANWQQPRGPGSDVSQKAGHPVTQVSWEYAVAFCAWAGQVSGREVRLPSEAEWEKAARGTDGRIYPWGNQAADSSYCNFNMNEKDTTSAGKYSPKGDSLYGCTDMAGNVFEWTSSLYKAYPYNAKDGREDQKNTDWAVRVVRGGAFYNDQYSVRCAYRNGNFPYYRGVCHGFRVWVSPISNSESNIRIFIPIFSIGRFFRLTIRGRHFRYLLEIGRSPEHNPRFQ